MSATTGRGLVGPLFLLTSPHRPASKLELGEAQAAPALRGMHERGEHQLQHRLLAKAARNDLEPPPLLDEEALQEIRRAGGTTMRHWQPQVGDAGPAVAALGQEDDALTKLVGDVIGELANVEDVADVKAAKKFNSKGGFPGKTPSALPTVLPVMPRARIAICPRCQPSSFRACLIWSPVIIASSDICCAHSLGRASHPAHPAGAFHVIVRHDPSTP
jgi:hypothetical protein